MGRMSLLGVAGGLAQVWTPASLANLAAWYYAHTDYVTLDGSDHVLEWADRSGNGNTLEDGDAASDPDYVADGWATGVDTIAFSGAPFLLHPSPGSTEVDFSGSDVAFSALLTMQFTANADQVAVSWSHSTGNARSLVRTDNAGTGRLRYERRDDAGTTVQVTGSDDLGTGHRRLGVIFHGTTVSLYVDTSLDVDAGACNVGTATFDRFRVGTGPIIDALNGNITEIVIVGRAITASEWGEYYDYSVAEFGA